MQRRHFVFTMAAAAGAELLGCGGSAAPAAGPVPAPPPPAPPVWDPSPLLFIAGRPGSIDLSLTLPPTVRRGGSFGLAPTSSPLPAQITLSAGGVLSTSAPIEGATSGVIFVYDEPA